MGAPPSAPAVAARRSTCSRRSDLRGVLEAARRARPRTPRDQPAIVLPDLRCIDGRALGSGEAMRRAVGRFLLGLVDGVGQAVGKGAGDELVKRVLFARFRNRQYPGPISTPPGNRSPSENPGETTSTSPV